MKRIELAKIIRDKNPKLYRRLPNFVIRAVERLICAKKINHVLDNYSHLAPMDFIQTTLQYIGTTHSLHGTENIPSDAKLIFASNHPLGGLDGLILALGLSKAMQGNNIRLIVNDLLMNLEPLRPLFVPVNKHGSQSVEYARAQNELYESNDAIITFPSGLCSRLIQGAITDTPWKRSFITKAIEHKRVIVPTYIKGRNSMLFYRTAKLRNRLGLKANLEMILLPREMFAQKGKHVDIYFGKPITIDDSHTAKEWIEIIRREAYSLGPEIRRR